MFAVESMGLGTGNRFYVDSGTGTDGAGYGRNPDSPTATVDYAVGLCTASNGDIIYVMPGHAESLGADSAVDVDVAGVTIIGLGSGALRPTFTATAIAGDFKLAAASIRIENLLFLSGIDATTAVTGATFQMAGGSVYVGNLVNEQGMLSTWTVATNA